MDDETRARFGTLEGWIEALRSAEGFYPGAEGFRVGPIRLFVKAVNGDYHIFQREEDGTESDLTDALSLQGIDVSETAPTAAQVLVYDAALDKWVPSAPSAPGAHALGGAAHTADTLANLNSKVSDATLDDHGASRPPTGHTHDDRYYTEAEHGGVSPQGHHVRYADAEAIAAVEAEPTLDLTGDVTIAAAKSVAVDTIAEKTPAAGVTIDDAVIKDNKITPKSSEADSYFHVTTLGTTLGLDTDDSFVFLKTANIWMLYLDAAWRLKVTPTEAGLSVPLDMTSQKITNLGAPVAASDAARKADLHDKYTDAEAVSAVNPVFLVDFGTEINGQQFTP